MEKNKLLHAGIEVLVGVVVGVAVAKTIGRLRFERQLDSKQPSLTTLSPEEIHRHRVDAFRIDGVIRRDPMGMDTFDTAIK